VGLRGIALTFDDGPDARGTPAVLDALDRAEARATFFVIAPSAERHPDLVQRIAEDGHTIGVHCDAHVRHTDQSRAEVASDLERALGRLSKLSVGCELWRTPWGATAPWTSAIADDHGLRLVGWDVDTNDWRGDRAHEMFSATRSGLVAGAIVLAHDGVGPGARREDCAETARYVELVAGHARDRGLSLDGLQ
jgi:peptidoglycan/xylan/chitin deacetylase (PgdA/CDA1 family)